MYNGKRILAFVPARIGSKRVKEKNIQMLDNKPLFMHSVEIAKQSKYIDDILVSTDSQEIKDISIENGCVLGGLRPEHLSGDRARIIDAILYEVENAKLKPDVVVLLQPTFPFRTLEILDGAIEKYFQTGEKSVITVTEVLENPVFFRSIDSTGKLQKVLNTTSDIRSQDFSKFYRIAGNVYVNNFSLLTSETVLNENEYPFEIDREYCLDIDTYLDLEEARNRVKGGK
ncbi:MAG: acylneuraminate cytidylyltransferase family protein [Clostridiales bacterium]|nr:acylneuraminate cytidylyltransferase family protein [Clostridiales bacterium]